MAWNEPPSGKDDKDPWGNPKRGNDSPPDLDELFKKLNESLGGIFGNKGGGNNKGGGSAGGSNSMIFGVLLVAAVIYAGLNTVYTVDAREQGVVLRMGKFNSIAGKRI